MPMKFFVLLLCFIPHTAFGLFDEYRSFGDNDDPEHIRRFTESLEHFSESFGMLMYLATKDYAPAQQILGLVNQDFKKVKNYLEDYNNRSLIAVQPPTEDSRNLFQKFLDTWFKDTSEENIDEPGTFIFSVLFHESLAHLTEGLYLLNILQKQNYEPAREFQNNFEENIANTMKKFGVPVYLPSEELNKKCKRIFANYFAPGK